MKSVKVYLMKSLVDGGQGGNPAGVVLEADSLNYDNMQMVAARVGVSETAFLSTSRVATYKLDFFTPARQIPHCGHATIAAFCLLSQLGVLKDGQYTKETIDGIRTIQISTGTAFMEQKPPQYLIPQDKGIELSAISQSLSIPTPDLWQTHPPLAVHTGNRFLIIPLPDLRTLKSIQPVFSEIEWISEVLDCIGFYPFTLETNLPDRVASARMFAPRFGIPEESATGTAAGPLAGYLYDKMNIQTESYYLEQGWEMAVPSPSLIQIRTKTTQQQITQIMVGGRAIIDRELTISF